MTLFANVNGITIIYIISIEKPCTKNIFFAEETKLRRKKKLELCRFLLKFAVVILLALTQQPGRRILG